MQPEGSSQSNGKIGRPVTQPCGTVAAYKRHRRHREEACDKCKAAYAEAHRGYYAKRMGLT